jgi:2,3-bisphosphoglycerate-dependent phosphoglycerate mutase
LKNIYLVRHGESLANVTRDVYRTTPDHAVPLSERGATQAGEAGKALAEILQADLEFEARVRLWTSPYKRTRQTANLVEEQLRKIPLELDRREHINLCEQQFGLFDGVPDEALHTAFPAEHAHYELAKKHEGRFWARMPLGESRFDVAVRVHQAFGTFLRDAERHGIENIVVVCHGVTLRAFVMQWLHLPYEWFDQQKNPGNCDIYRIECNSGTEGRYVYKGGAIA